MARFPRLTHRVKIVFSRLRWGRSRYAASGTARAWGKVLLVLVYPFCALLTVILVAFFLFWSLSVLQNRITLRPYYADTENFITVTGEISYIDYNEEGTELRLGISNCSELLSDNYFRIVAENTAVIKQNGGDELLQVGETITFVTAPGYFGDGYVMPIIAVSAGEVVLLEFEVGYANFWEWLTD